MNLFTDTVARWTCRETLFNLSAKQHLICSPSPSLCQYSDLILPAQSSLLLIVLDIPLNGMHSVAADRTSTLSLHLPSATVACCGMEWMATSPRLSPASAAIITCNNTLLSHYPPGRALCPCKQFQPSTINPYANLLNYTALASPPPGGLCSAYGCPAGQRPCRTETLPTLEDYQWPSYFTLFETACQGVLFFIEMEHDAIFQRNLRDAIWLQWVL